MLAQTRARHASPLQVVRAGWGRRHASPVQVVRVDEGEARVALPCAVGGVGKKRDRPCALEGARERALVLRAGARDAAGKELASLRDEPPQAADLLVVDVVDLLDAEGADLATRPLAPGSIFSAF